MFWIGSGLPLSVKTGLCSIFSLHEPVSSSRIYKGNIDFFILFVFYLALTSLGFGSGWGYLPIHFPEWARDSPARKTTYYKGSEHCSNLPQQFRAHSNRRSEEHTSELQSLMRTSYAAFCLNKKKQ